MAWRKQFRYRVAPGFDLRLVVFSHGWIDLEPFCWSEEEQRLDVVVATGGQAADLTVRMGKDAVLATARAERPLGLARLASLRAVVPHMLRLDEDLAGFWAMCARTPRLSWVARRGGGRILRGATVFEDLMKLLFTTNCSWAATKLMTSRLVEALGAPAPSGRRSFPDPSACAAQDEAFYRDVVRAGYRAKSCVALSKAFASGELEAAWFADRTLPPDVVRERLLALPGFGPYAAGQAMRTLGHYKDLALDSWCRARLAEMAGRKKPPADRSVAKRFAAFGPYDGLALWMELTAEWHGEG